MKGCIFALLLTLFFNLSGQADLWEKKGITGGIIQEISFDGNLGLFTILSDSGIYRSSNLMDWFPMNEGLRELAPYDFAWVPISITKSLYVVLTRDGVFGRVLSSEAGQSWPSYVMANPLGLEDAGGTAFGYQEATKIGIYKDQSGFYVYLSLENIGLFYRNFNPLNPSSPWDQAGWQRDTNYTGSNLITSIASLEGGSSLFIAAKNLSGNGGSIYKKSGSGQWNLKASAPSIFTVLSEDPLSSQVILAGTEENGVFLSTDGGENFNLICNQNPGYGPWKGLSFTMSGSNIYAIGSAYDNASSMENVFFINPQDCNNAFTRYDYFMGESIAVFLKDNLYNLCAYVGTLGQGIWEFPSTDALGNPIAVSGPNRIIFNNISDIAFVKSNSRPDAPPVILASSRAEGFYKCFKPDYCTRYFYSPWTGKVKTVRGTSLAPVPPYDEYAEVRYSGEETITGNKTIFLGTMDTGLFRTDNGGASWRKILSFPVDPATSNEFEILKVALAPDFDPYNASKQHIFVLTRDAKVFVSLNGGQNWSQEVDLNPQNLKVIGEDLVISPAYNSDIPLTQNVFVGISFPENISTTPSILKRTYDDVEQKFIWIPLNSSFQIPAKKIALSPCFGMVACSECPIGDLECEKEKSSILIGTKGNGLYYSFDSGLTINQFNDLNSDGCGYDQNPQPITITALAFHPKTDIPNTGNRLLNYHIYHIFNGQQTSAFLYSKWDGEQQKWICTDANTGDGNGNPLDLRINKIAFQPDFGIDNYHSRVLIGHEIFGMYKNNHPPSEGWANLNGFYNVPETIYSISECPDEAFSGNPNKIVIAGTEHFGVMISFDSGESYFPFGEGFEYTGNLGKKYTLHNAQAVACTGIFDPCGSNPCPQHRVLAAGSDCSQFDSNFNCISKIYKGILYTEFKDFSSISKWRESTIGGNSMDGHFVTELRYCSQDLPVYASDFGFGVLFSDKAEPNGWGKIWHLDNNGEYPIDITDLTCPGGQSGPSFRLAASSPDLRPGRPGFIWGAQSGGGGSLRAGNGKAKFKTSPSGSWQSCTGLSSNANWRAIIMLPSQNVLIGSYGTDTSLSEGIYRNSQDGSTCDTWESANMGFSSGDSQQITQNYSKKIAGFANVENGVLVAVQKGGLNNYEGGVFFSDKDSDGLAWVPVNSGMSCTSNYEVYNGQNIYTGSTCNGVYSTDVISYTGYPTAYFTYERSSNPWYETRFTFYDRSAGLPTSREWDFNNDGTIDATPSTRSYTYDFNIPFGYSSYNAKIISYQNSYSDTYQLSDDNKGSVEVVYTKIPKIEKDGNYIKIYWDRITSGGHSYVYNIYSSNSPQGTSATLLISVNDGSSGSDYDCTTSLCWYRFIESSSEKYYRIKTTW